MILTDSLDSLCSLGGIQMLPMGRMGQFNLNYGVIDARSRAGSVAVVDDQLCAEEIFSPALLEPYIGPMVLSIGSF